MMKQITLNVAGELSNLINKKGFAEIFVRTVQGKCAAIAKCAVAVSPEKSDEIANIASHAVNGIGLSDHKLSVFKNDIMRQINPQGIRRDLANLSRNQAQNTALLKNMAGNVNSIYSKVSCIQALSWLNGALSVCNLAATVISTAVICKKLNAISERLDIISDKLESIDNKVSSVKRVQYETNIAKPCRDLIREYKMILDDLENGREVSKDKLVETINACCSQIETIYKLRAEYNMNDVLLLLYDLMPIYTNLIIKFYQYYYDRKKPKYILHEDWMKVYSFLSCDAFRNEIRDHYFFEERVHNKQLNDIMDCQYLVTVGSRFKIEQVLKDLSECESNDEYREIDEFCERYALQQAKAMETEMISQFGEKEAEEMLETAKPLYQYMNIS